MTDQTTTEVAASVPEIEEQRSHRALVWVLIVLGTIVMVLSTLNTWAERQLLDTDSWVDASVALLDDDAVRHEVSVRLVNALYENVDIGPTIDEQLPEQLQGLGGPLAGVLRDPLIDTADRVLDTEPVRVVWKDANRLAHTAVLAILEDDVGDNVSTVDGKVVIDLGAVVVQIGEEIGIPQAALDAIPEDAGQIEVVDSDELESAQDAVKLVKLLSTVFFLLVIVLFGAAVALAGNWRRAATRNVGAATAVGGFIVLAALRLGVNAISAAPDTSGARAATSSVLAIATELLRRSAWTEVLIGLLIVLGASLIGPARYAKWVRRYAAQGFRRSAVLTWAGMALVVLIILAWSPFSAATNWVTTIIVLVLLVIGIEAIRRTSLAEDDARIAAAEVELVDAEVEAELVDAELVEAELVASGSVDSEADDISRA